jgi:type VI secretion system secreted protein Hcp
MAFDMFLKVDTIPGESADKAHANEIDVLSWQWGLTQSGSAHVGGGSGSGKVDVKDLTVTKYVDAASPALLKYCCTGAPLKSAVLTIRKAGGTPLEYYVVTLTNVIISSVTPGGASGQDRLSESITLNFGQFQVQYTPQKADGTGGAAKVVAWNVASNAEA